jgi:outer membrane protein assembly factor BamE (lipoprotein component of BamABCDE complex)
MKKLILILPLIALAIVLVSGCASNGSVTGKVTATPESSKIKLLQDQIKVGMTQDEVRSAAGDPGEIQMVSDSFAYWYYSENSDVLQVAFNNGKVSGEHFY